MPQRIMAMAPATVTLAVYANGTRPVYRAVCPAAIWAHHAIATTTKTIKCYQMAMTCASHTMLARYVGHVILSKPYTPAFWGEVLSSHTIQNNVCVCESYNVICECTFMKCTSAPSPPNCCEFTIYKMSTARHSMPGWKHENLCTSSLAFLLLL